MNRFSFVRRPAPGRLFLFGMFLIILLVSSGGLVYVFTTRATASDGGELAGSTIYVADTGHNAIQTLDAAGNQVSEWRFQPGEPAALNQPAAILVGDSGIVYVADSDNDILRLYDGDGIQIATWGQPGSEPGDFHGPRGLAVDSIGNIFVVDTLNNRIQKFDPEGNLLVLWGERGTDPGQFWQPKGIAIDGEDRVYIADHQNDRIQVFDSAGVFLFQWGQEGDETALLDHPESVAVGEDVVFVTDWNHRVTRFDLEGNYLDQWGSYGQDAAQFRYPAGLTHDACGNLWVADWGNHRLQLFDGDGSHLATYGESLWFEASFAYPTSVAVVNHGGDCDQIPGVAAKQIDDETATPVPTTSGVAQFGPDGHFTEIQVAGDGTPHLIPLAEIQYGAPVDGIPAISFPAFSGPDDWESEPYWEDGLVIGVEVGGKWRAYPFQILVQHEIVNDVFEGQPLLVSYCPLCGSAIVFDRDIDIDEELVSFGVSGKLYNSDLLMYDRKTETLWSQITGTAVVGDLTGMRLPVYPSQVMTVSDWKVAHPDSEILSTTSFPGRNYLYDPYGNYALEPGLLFGVPDQDSRLHPKERVTGVELGGQIYGAYPDDAVVEYGAVNDDLDGVPLLVAADPGAGGNVVVFDRRVGETALTFNTSDATLIDNETGTTWNFQGLAINGELRGEQLREITPVKGFWFAWFAFHPSTDLWTDPSTSN